MGQVCAIRGIKLKKDSTEQYKEKASFQRKTICVGRLNRDKSKLKQTQGLKKIKDQPKTQSYAPPLQTQIKVAKARHTHQLHPSHKPLLLIHLHNTHSHPAHHPTICRDNKANLQSIDRRRRFRQRNLCRINSLLRSRLRHIQSM